LADPRGGRLTEKVGIGFWPAMALIVVAGVGLRVLHTLLVAPWPPGFFNDEAYYRTLAALVVQGAGFVRPGEFYGAGISVPTAERAPLYPLMLAGLAELGVTGPDPQRLLGALTGGGTIVALGLVARELAGDRAGLLAAGIAAAYPTLIAADGALMTESVYGLLAALMLLSALKLQMTERWRWAVALGVAGGLAALTRGEGLLLTVILLLGFLRHPAGRRAAAVAFLAFAVVLAPWTIRNYSVFDRPVLVATEGGETLAGANCGSTYGGELLGRWDVNCVKLSGKGNEAEQADKLGHDGLHYAADHVERVPVVLAVRQLRTWGLWEPLQRSEGRAQWVVTLGVVVYALLVPLAVYGFVLLRRRRAPTWVVVTPLITVLVSTALSYGSVRFRHSAELAFVVLAAVALDHLLRRRTVPVKAPPVGSTQPPSPGQGALHGLRNR
jgi:4-amino-4-deoxy-L-arabinose transferase-like glycosyltransferase